MAIAEVITSDHWLQLCKLCLLRAIQPTEWATGVTVDTPSARPNIFRLITAYIKTAKTTLCTKMTEGELKLTMLSRSLLLSVRGTRFTQLIIKAPLSIIEQPPAEGVPNWSISFRNPSLTDSSDEEKFTMVVLQWAIKAYSKRYSARDD